jgi:hypothetical protein
MLDDLGQRRISARGALDPGETFGGRTRIPPDAKGGRDRQFTLMICRAALHVGQQPIQVFRPKTRRVAKEGNLADMLDWPPLEPAMLIPLLGGPPKGKTPARRRALEFRSDIPPLAQ